MNDTLILSLNEFLSRCHRPLYSRGRINRLKNNDVLSLGGIRQCIGKQVFAYGQAYIEKQTHGWFRFVGLWTLPTKPTRPDVWVEGRFKVHKGQMNFEDGVTLAHLQAFYKVCRYLGVHKRAELERYFAAHERWEDIETLEYEYDLYWITENYLKKRACGSWFFAENLSPLFCGEVFLSGKAEQDIRDRVITQPLFAIVKKHELGESLV